MKSKLSGFEQPGPGEHPILKELREPAVLVGGVTKQQSSYLRDKF